MKTIDYPAGVALKTEEGLFYVKGNSRLRIGSTRILKSWSIPTFESKEADVNLPINGKLGFRDGTAIENVANGNRYVISEGQRFLVTTPEVVRRLKLKFIVVSNDEANLHRDGGEIK